MTTEETSPRPGTTADLARRVERLEMSHAELAKAVSDTNHKLDLVQAEQRHVYELMNTKFTGLETLSHETARDLKELLKFIQNAMAGAPEAQSPAAKALMDEYREFQRTVREHIVATAKKNEEYDDYILVQKTKSETASTLATRAFGGSVLGAIGGIIGVVLGLIALSQGGG
jgi:hypothetical protein